MRVEVHEDTDASGSVAAQRDDDHGAVAIEIGAFVERFVGMRIDLSVGASAGGNFCVCAGMTKPLACTAGLKA